MKKFVFERIFCIEGYWFIGVNCLIFFFIKCVICCKIKCSLEVLKMIYVFIDMIILEIFFKFVV